MSFGAWVLIIATGFTDGGVSSVPGFQSFAACEVARQRIEKNARIRLRGVCVRLTEDNKP